MLRSRGRRWRHLEERAVSRQARSLWLSRTDAKGLVRTNVNLEMGRNDSEAGPMNPRVIEAKADWRQDDR